MLLIWKNKGLVVPIYIIVSLIGTALIIGILQRNVGGLFSKIDFYTTLGIGFLISSFWTYITKDDFYKDKDGMKKKMDTINEFCFIKMEIWVYILLASSLIFLGNTLFNYFSPT